MLLRRDLFRCLLATGVAAANEPETIRILTFNLHHGEGIDGFYDVSRIGRFFLEQKADLIGVQEVDREFGARSRMEDQPAKLSSLLGFHRYYGPTIRNAYGNLVLSRYVINDARNVPLPNPAGEEQRKIVVTSIRVGDHTLTFLNTHLCHRSPANRESQFKKILEITRGLPEPVIITADFNTLPSREFMPVLLDNGFTSTRLLLGFKEGIDDILISESWRDRVLDGRIIHTRMTDHPAFWIDLRISP